MEIQKIRYRNTEVPKETSVSFAVVGREAGRVGRRTLRVPERDRLLPGETERRGDLGNLL